ncbi:hypothetical protein PTH_0620 [Pelotomaculum thermopropionicum SI]|uniref:Dynamin N-terminal domain-containing protein n=1 Tax=Pelotomaculum thermopropionicum (strain DSM 13744 / JCM 10971 / SI) TaxID=370438 RepID=A5D4L7_PELTS|nr:hypothetical protein PTH_0620 [Pelotomaculum thermopropionicum SI]
MDIGFGYLKEKVLNELEAVDFYAHQRESLHLAAYVKEVREKLRQDRFNLVVLGEFKRGKTTFLNALLGAEILPTAVVPLTSIITEIRYGEILKCKVCFLHGGTKEIELSEVAGYVTEEGNPGNEKKVKLVQLEYPSPYLKEGVVLIDTPGVGSVYQNNTHETYNYLPKVDAAIFMLSSDQPLSQAECDFLKTIKQYSTKTFFVLNKIDYLEDKDRQKALDFARKILKEKAGFENVDVIPLSAKMALEGKLEGDEKKLSGSNIQEFTRTLEQFLLAEKGAAMLIAACSKGINTADELLMGIELEIKTLVTPLEELRSKTSLFDKMAGKLCQEKQDTKYIFQGELDKVYHVLEEEITRFQKRQSISIENEVDRLYQEKRSLSGRELLKSLETLIESKLKFAFENWEPEVNEKVNVAFEKVVARFTDKANKAIEELLRQSADIFEITVEGFTKMDVLTDDSKLYYIFGQEQSMLLPDPVKVGAILLPRFISGPRILKEMKKKVERELDRNCGRLRSDYSDRIYKSAMKFQRTFEEKLSQIIEGTRTVLTRAMDKKQRSEKEVNEVIAMLNKERDQLVNIKARLKTVMEEIKF